MRTSFVSTHNTMKTAGSPEKTGKLAIYKHTHALAALLIKSRFHYFRVNGTNRIETYQFDMIKHFAFRKILRFHTTSATYLSYRHDGVEVMEE